MQPPRFAGGWQPEGWTLKENKILQNFWSGAYLAAFISKLSDAEGEAAETQTWLEFAVRCGYIEPDTGRNLYRIYDEIISMLIGMISKPNVWVLPSGQKSNV